MESIETMEKLNELLPGIEEFLVQVLAQEKLSSGAEERRQYFVERLDILRLPPSLPPRAGKRLSVELLEESEESCGIPADQVPELNVLLPTCADDSHGTEVSEVDKDFAAEQRKISRKMIASISSDKDVNVEPIEDSDSAKGVKVYDDIDHLDPTSSSIQSQENGDEDDDDINALYEIPVSRQPQLLTSDENSLSQPADVSSMATANSIDDISDDVLDASAPAWQPPPLPPRTKKKESESAESRVSTNSLEGPSKPPDLPFRPPLPRRNDMLYARSEKSDKSEKSEKSDVSDGGSTSYESFDENEHDSEHMSKLSIRLPKRSKKKSKTSSKLSSSKARSSSTWEVNVPFKKLDHVLISGELLHKGKLSWNRRLVAISNGCLALYKPDKETRPVFVIPLAGFSAYLGESLGRKGFEMKLSQENGESYTFAVDFKEWGNLWCEHINGLSQGLSVPAYHQHLARTFSGSEPSTFGSKREPEGNLSNSNSNLSVSSDGVESDDSAKPRLRANKVMRMGSFAFRATQFFENWGKKTTSKRKCHSMSSPTENPDSSLRDGIQEESSISSASIGGLAISPSSDLASPVFDESFHNSSAFSSPSSMELPPLPSTPPPPVPCSIKHQGYLHIFSSFNKRRWGQRWCLVRENMFECYRTQSSQPCELNFLLKGCVLRQALAETNSPLALMLLENNKEKITVEPPTKEELSQWLQVLMGETGTDRVPEGLEEYYVELEDNLLTSLEGDYSDIVGVSVMKSWEVGSVPILGKTDKADDKPDDAGDASNENKSEGKEDVSKDQLDPPEGDKYLYSAVIKRPSYPALEDLAVSDKEEQAMASGEVEEAQIPRFTDNLAVYNANKNTTDSGFYSVKEANSDSESGSEVKADNMSPLPQGVPSVSEGGSTLPKCNNADKEISHVVAFSVGEHPGDEDEDVLEKTMTSDDFKDNMDGGKDTACAASVVVSSGSVNDSKHACDKSDLKVGGSIQVDAPGQSNPGPESAVSKENHVHSKQMDTQLANGEESHPRDKLKKKKKKGKGKKNKQKHQEHESSPVGNRTQHVTDTASHSHSSQRKHSTDTPQVSESPVEGVGVDVSQSSTHTKVADNCQRLTHTIVEDDSKRPTHTNVVDDSKRSTCTEERDSSKQSTHTGKADDRRQSDCGTCQPPISLAATSAESLGKPSPSVHISKFSQLIGRDIGNKTENDCEHVPFSVAKSFVSDKLRDKHALNLSVAAVKNDSHSHSQCTKPRADNGSESVDKELLDSWGLSSILTRGLVSDDSDFAEGGDDLSSPRDRSSDEAIEQSDLPCSSSLKLISDSVVDVKTSFSCVGGAQLDRTSSVLNDVEKEKAKGPEENEVIAELRERIGNLREKLVQIKRKRIAVRDKRVRAFSAEERTVCDREYLALESECKETAARIQNLEDELKMAISTASHK